jgi:hypothetical protein
MQVYQIYGVVRKAERRMVYIGMTRNHPVLRWYGHLLHPVGRLGDAMREHGPDAFAIIQLASAVGQENARAVEFALINQWETLVPNGYNAHGRSSKHAPAPKPENNQKRCHGCKQVKPIRYFDLPRHRLCTKCRARSVMPAVEAASLRRGARPLANWSSYKNYAVERARQAAADVRERARAAGKPVKTPAYRTIKYCVRCGFKKHVSQFDHPRDRICLACYDPRPLP